MMMRHVDRLAQKIGMVYMTIAGMAAVAIGYWTGGAVGAGITAGIAILAWIAVATLTPRLSRLFSPKRR